MICSVTPVEAPNCSAGWGTTARSAVSPTPPMNEMAAVSLSPPLSLGLLLLQEPLPHYQALLREGVAVDLALWETFPLPRADAK